MSGFGRGLRRRVVVVALLGVAGLFGGVLGGDLASGVQAEAVHVETERLGYDCGSAGSASGVQRVGVWLGASFPAGAEVGHQVQPTGVTVRLSVPRSALADLTGQGAASVTGAAHLTVQLGPDEAVSWEKLAVPSTPIPAEGELVLTAKGDVPPATAGAPGELTFTAGALTVLLGTADAAALALDCTPGAGVDTRIATVPVSGDETSAPPTTGTTGEDDGTPGTGDTDAPPIPGDRRTPLAGPEQDTGVIPEACHPIGEDTTWCAYIGGYTNIDKLGASALSEPGFLNLNLPNLRPCGDGSEWFWFCQDGSGELNHEGEKRLPPTKNSFLAYGLVPNEATIELNQVGPMDIDVRAQVIPPFDGSVIVSVRMVARLSSATVNGVRLDVGPHCQTEPIDVRLTAQYPTEYTPDAGGVLDGFVDIPPFSGCGANEDLDPLLTGLISSDHNYVKLTQGNACSLSNQDGCPPEVPELRR